MRSPDAATATPVDLDRPPPPAEPLPPQRVIKVRRDYNAWVANETTEDYALRFTPRSFRKWSEWRVANTAFGAASFLILEAVGATLLVQYGFVNAFWAILATGIIIFAAGWPISVAAAKYGLDMDLLTRGAGFGYLGSTITSLIYASFTFIFFALEAAVMAYALELAFDIPPAIGYLICALVVIPLATHGVTVIGKLQVWTQPLWLAMLVLPFFYVFAAHPDAIDGLRQYAGETGQGGAFNLLFFGAALTVGVALITQMGEQADYLRFMPEKTRANRGRWWFGVAMGGPGWVVLGVAKMLAGALLAWLAIQHAVPADRAVDPNQMYLGAWNLVFPHYGWAIAATVVFVVISQMKINVTNAYAGSLAWSNFFARLTHHHPGRVVWMVFNTLIALLLMQLNVFEAIGSVLGLYANVAIAWLMAVVADLVVNKPLGLSPKGIEFKRAHLYDINPVGVGAMGLATVLSVAAHLGAFGELAQAFSAVIAMVTAFVTAPLIAWATQGRYYIARTSDPCAAGPDVSFRPAVRGAVPPSPMTAEGSGASAGAADATAAGLYRRLRTCVICTRPYEGEDMAHCPAYQGPICSLCCSLDARCEDLCKPEATLRAQWNAALHRLMPRSWATSLDTGLAHYLLLMGVVTPLLAGLFGLLYREESRRLTAEVAPALAQAVTESLWLSYVKAFSALLLAAGVVCWWLVLTHRSRQVAQEESNRQTEALHRQAQVLQQEIASHRRTDAMLQAAKQAAEAAQAQAEQANRAKSRYITTISHELRTPLNSILGYAQLLEEDAAMPAHRRHAVSVIRRGGDHLLGLIEGTLDIARIESGRFSLEPRPMRFAQTVAEIAAMFELQAAAQGIAFRHEVHGRLPEWVRADDKRLRQILINVLGNAVKFTREGQVHFAVSHSRELARFEITDTGPGMTADELDRVFEPFERGQAAGPSAPGSGLGLTISKMLTELMGGEMTVASAPGQGTTFRITLFLAALDGEPAGPAGATRGTPVGYMGDRRRLLVVDNEEADRELLRHWLEPLGFEVETAASGEEGLARADGVRPHAVMLDLAMPGIDGWETLRRLRERGATDLPVAIVSANAFDKALENGLGITPADFLVKPVRHADLLEWLGRRLALTWVVRDPVVARAPEPRRHGTPGDPAAAQAQDTAPRDPGLDGMAPAATRTPPTAVRTASAAHALQQLNQAARIGHLRGVLAAIAALGEAGALSNEEVVVYGEQARLFRFDPLAAELARRLADTGAVPAAQDP